MLYKGHIAICQLIPRLISSSHAEHLLQSPFPPDHISNVSHRSSPLNFLPPTLFCPSQHLKQALPENPQATLVGEAHKLRADLYLSLHFSKSNPSVSSQLCRRNSAVTSPYSLSPFWGD